MKQKVIQDTMDSRGEEGLRFSFFCWGSTMNWRVAGSIWGQEWQILCMLTHGDSLHKTEQLGE